MEKEKPMHRSLMTPGHENLSPWPPVGQLKFEAITAMSEEDVERAFRERHGLEGVFKRSDKTQALPFENRPERRLVLKKMTLARLEGIPMSPSSHVWEWYDSSGEYPDPENDLKVAFSRILTPECKERIHDVEKSIAREAAVYAPTEAVRKIERAIEIALREHGIPPMSVSEIINTENIPHHSDDTLDGFRFTIPQSLKLFLLQIQGLSEAESAQRMGSTSKSIENIKSQRFSAAAKAAIRKARGYNV